jgi:hypothetical protein
MRLGIIAASSNLGLSFNRDNEIQYAGGYSIMIVFSHTKRIIVIIIKVVVIVIVVVIVVVVVTIMVVVVIQNWAVQLDLWPERSGSSRISGNKAGRRTRRYPTQEGDENDEDIENKIKPQQSIVRKIQRRSENAIPWIRNARRTPPPQMV